MKTITPLLVAALLVSGCGSNGSSEVDAIQQTFAAYKSAILNTDGVTAAENVSQRTIDEYQQYVDWCRKADRQTLQKLSTINKFQVLLLKHRIRTDELKTMDGKAVFIYAVDHDWIGKNSVIVTTIGDIQASEGRGTAAVYIEDQKTPVRFHFTKEDDSWKFDLIQSIRDADQVLKEQIRQLDVTENEFIFRMIETVSGRKVPDSIWEPLG
jgi:hypothetical protein